MRLVAELDPPDLAPSPHTLRLAKYNADWFHPQLGFASNSQFTKMRCTGPVHSKRGRVTCVLCMKNSCDMKLFNWLFQRRKPP
jgi:hypothetical protein